MYISSPGVARFLSHSEWCNVLCERLCKIFAHLNVSPQKESLKHRQKQRGTLLVLLCRSHCLPHFSSRLWLNHVLCLPLTRQGYRGGFEAGTGVCPEKNKERLFSCLQVSLREDHHESDSEWFRFWNCSHCLSFSPSSGLSHNDSLV